MSASSRAARVAAEPAIKELLSRLAALHYRFITVTPETHGLVLARFGKEPGGSLRDIFGWNRSFAPAALPEGLFELLQRAEACQPVSAGLWRATLRVSTVGHLLFAHSGFPTLEPDSVFFGPDTYRFVRAIRHLAPTATRAVDIGCGAGVGGIALGHFGSLAAPVVLADINPRALALARVNAAHADVPAEVVESDVLTAVDGKVDLIISNPPYLNDASKRAYRHGGGEDGSALSVRIVRDSLQRLARDGGGTLLLYTGVAITNGADRFLAQIEPLLRESQARYAYEEVDPDVFGNELATASYRNVERIAAVLLQATLEPANGQVSR